MNTSSIELKGEELINITKQVIKHNGFQCLWNTLAGQSGKSSKCQVQLVCWEAYHRHLLVCHVKSQQKKFYCGIQEKCSVEYAGRNLFKGVQDVEKHVNIAHIRDRLRSLPFDCPVKDCRTVVTVRATAVEDHFMQAHPDLYGQTITLPSDRLRPLWTTYQPPLNPPPELPPMPPAAYLIPPIPGIKNNAPPEPEMDNKSERPRSPIEFEDLETQERYNFETIGFGNIIEDSLLAETACSNHLSGSQSILDPGVFGYRTPPQSILWDAFSVRLTEREQEWRDAKVLEHKGEYEGKTPTIRTARKSLGR